MQFKQLPGPEPNAMNRYQFHQAASLPQRSTLSLKATTVRLSAKSTPESDIHHKTTKHDRLPQVINKEM